MKKTNGTTLLLVLIIALYLLTRYESNNIDIIIYSIFGLYIFNYAFREVYSLKSYFLHPFNIFTSKFKRTVEFDFTKEILINKFIEVMGSSSNFKSVELQEENNEIFAITPNSWKGTGENIYIEFIEKEENTIVNYCSLNVTDSYSITKREKAYSELMAAFDASLII